MRAALTLRRTRKSVRHGLLWLCVLPCCAAEQAAAPVQHAAPATPQRAAMESDLNRLVALAKQLKTDVDRTRRDELNVRVVRNADVIEKLARSARSRIH